MQITRLIALATLVLAAGCRGADRAADAPRDLQLAPAPPLDQYAPEELGTAAPAVAQASPTAVRPRAARTVRQSSGAVYRAPRKVTHSRRDAAIGAGVGAISGALIGRNLKGVVIGAVAGGALGAVVGATVDVDHR